MEGKIYVAREEIEGENEKAAKEVKVGQSDRACRRACAGPAVAIGRRQRLIELCKP